MPKKIPFRVVYATGKKLHTNKITKINFVHKEECFEYHAIVYWRLQIFIQILISLVIASYNLSCDKNNDYGNYKF